MAQPPWSMGHAQGSVQVLVDEDRAACQCAPPSNLVDLQGEVLKAYGVVAADGTLELQREDQIPIAPRAGRKGRAALGLRYLASAVELGNRALVQEAGAQGGTAFTACPWRD